MLSDKNQTLLSDEKEDSKSVDSQGEHSGIEAAWKKNVDLTGIASENLRDKAYKVLSGYDKMWSGELGRLAATEHHINVNPGTVPSHAIPYSQGPEMCAITETHIAALLKAGVIDPANSEWSRPVVFAPKKDGKLRFCIDYRRLNQAKITDSYTLPRLDDCIDSRGNAAKVSTVDSNCGYCKIPVSEEDKDKTYFTTHSGTYRYRRMHFGLRNAPATFQRGAGYRT